MKTIRLMAIGILATPAIALASQTSKIDPQESNEASKRVGLSSWVVQAIAKMKPRTQDQKEVCDCIDDLATGAPGAANGDLIESQQSASTTVPLHTVLLEGLRRVERPSPGVAECADLFAGRGHFSLEGFNRSVRGEHWIGRQTGTNVVMGPQGAVEHLSVTAARLYGCSHLIASVAERVMNEVRQSPPEDVQSAIRVAEGYFSQVSIKHDTWNGNFIVADPSIHPYMQWKTIPLQVRDANGQPRTVVLSYANGEHTVVEDGVILLSKDQIKGVRTEIALRGGGSFTGSAASKERKKELQQWSKCLLAFNSITTQLSNGLLRQRELPNPASKAAQALIQRANFAEALAEAGALTAGNLRLDMSKGGVRWRIGRYAFAMEGGVPSIANMGSSWFSETHANGQEMTVQARWSRSQSNGFAFN